MKNAVILINYINPLRQCKGFTLFIATPNHLLYVNSEAMRFVLPEQQTAATQNRA
jgi:hypothetical protein